MHIDWTALATKLNCVHRGGNELALEALKEVLGDQAIVDSVEYYIEDVGGEGAELARSVLWHLHPVAAINHCYKIYTDDPDIDRRRSAIELLRVIADRRVLAWVPEFLNDPDGAIQAWGAGVVDQLVFSERVEAEECEDILVAMKIHKNPNVRYNYESVQEFLNLIE